MRTREHITTYASHKKREYSASKVKKPSVLRSIDSPVSRILHLQRTIGNKAVQRLIKTGLIQESYKILNMAVLFKKFENNSAGNLIRTFPAPTHDQYLCPDSHDSLCKNDNIKSLDAGQVTKVENNYIQKQEETKETKGEHTQEEQKKEEKKPTFKECDDKQKELILAGIEEAKKLANKALKELKKDISILYSGVIRANFGTITGKQKEKIISRYEHVVSSLDGKKIICSTNKKKCGRAECPGNKIIIRKLFGTASCPPGLTMLHEAVHNAGACKDIDKGKGYPPKDSENNAYSYEYCAQDIAKGLPEIKLPPKKPVVIELRK